MEFKFLRTDFLAKNCYFQMHSISIIILWLCERKTERKRKREREREREKVRKKERGRDKCISTTDCSLDILEGNQGDHLGGDRREILAY